MLAANHDANHKWFGGSAGGLSGRRLKIAAFPGPMTFGAENAALPWIMVAPVPSQVG